MSTEHPPNYRRAGRAQSIESREVFKRILLTGILVILFGFQIEAHGDTPPPEPTPDISVNPASVDFGNVNIDSSSEQTVTVSNEGNVDLTIGTITDPQPFSITIDNCSGQTLTLLAGCTIIVKFAPTEEGISNNSFDIPSDDPDENPVTVSLSGTGINNPPTANPGGPYTGIEGQEITLDGSGSTDSDGIITLYEWDIDNDGTYDYSSSSPTQSHTYAQQGTYTIKLRVTDDLGATDEATTTATISDTSPVASFTASPASGTEPLTVNLTDTSTAYDGIASQSWDFGDGSSAGSGPSVSHVYNQNGTYTITLTVTDGDGSTDTEIAVITVNDTSPTANFTGNPTSGEVTLTVNFTNNSTGYDQPLSYKWDFDNNGTIDSTAQNPSYTYTTAGTYSVSLTVMDSDGSTNTLARPDYITVTTLSLSYPSGDTGIQGISRIDGGNDSDNLINNKPRVDVEYKFEILVTDLSGNAPQYVRLYMTQRSNPLSGDFYAYDMSCSGDWTTGATCTYVTTLGPSAVHKFYFEAKTADSTVVSLPGSGANTGPTVQLLTGYNLVGAPRDINSANLDGLTAFGSSKTYRWVSFNGYYTGVTTTNPAVSGEGYFSYKENPTLLEIEDYGDLQETSYTYQLQPGWNIISNPYAGNVELKDIQVKRGSNSPVSWTEATSNAWLTNAIYYYNGADWGKTYSFESAGGLEEATLIPWIGYWIYLNATDDTYYLVIPMP